MKRLLIGALAAVTLTMGLSACKPTTDQDRANAAAKQTNDLIVQAEGGADVTAQLTDLKAELEKATGCVIVDVEGGAIDPATHDQFVADLNTQIAAFMQTHPGFLVGHYEGADHGALLVLDCTAKS